MDIHFYAGPRNRVGDKSGVTRVKSAALETLKVILTDTRAKIYSGHLYKIGISSNPQIRSYGHGEVIVDEEQVMPDMRRLVLVRGLWARMHVIWQTGSDAGIRQAEREFIQFALTTYGGVGRDEHRPGQQVFSFNDNPGGEGPLPLKGPYFLYVLQSGG